MNSPASTSQPADPHQFSDWNADHPPTEVTLDDIRAAAARLEGVAVRTPVLTSDHLDELVGARVFLKHEGFQRVGAFKFRGAFNALANLDDEAKRRGVLTYSSGNHAQGIALAGKLLSIPTTIIMPSDAPDVKVRVTRSYLGTGSEVILYDRETITREDLGSQLAADRGLTTIPPYDHPHVIAGQGTVALELLEQLREREQSPPDVLFVCVGGGGLISGCAIAAEGVAAEAGDTVRIIGVEPDTADDATLSFRSRALHVVHNPDTIADGARTPFLGKHTFPLVCRHVDEMMTVSDAALVEAMTLAIEHLKVVVEPAGVLGLAGVLGRAREGTLRDARSVGVVLSGANIDAHRLGALLAGGV